jgi:hypothetical protein
MLKTKSLQTNDITLNLLTQNQYDVTCEPSTLDPLLSGLTSSILNIATSSILPPLEPLTSPIPKIDKMIKYMKSKVVVRKVLEFLIYYLCNLLKKIVVK